MSFQTIGGYFPYTRTKMDAGTVDFTSSTKKVMIVTTAPDGTEEFVDELTELGNMSGYTGGFAGAGRLAMTSGSFAFGTDVSDLTAGSFSYLTYALTSLWTSLGTPGTSIAGFVIITEITNDAASIPWLFLPFLEGSFTLTGADRTLSYPSHLVRVYSGVSAAT